MQDVKRSLVTCRGYSVGYVGEFRPPVPSPPDVLRSKNYIIPRFEPAELTIHIHAEFTQLVNHALSLGETLEIGSVK